MNVREARPDQADRAARILADAFLDDPVIAWLVPDRAGRTELLPGLMRAFVDRALATERVLIATDNAGGAAHGAAGNGPGSAAGSGPGSAAGNGPGPAGTGTGGGEETTMGAVTGAAAWIRVPEPATRFAADSAESTSGASNTDEAPELSPALRPYLDRLATFDALLRERHPTRQAHLWLPAIGVREEARGTGVGSALLEHRLSRDLPRSRAEGDAGPAAYLEASSERNRALYERFGFRAYGEPIHLPDGPAVYPMWRDGTAPNSAEPRRDPTGNAVTADRAPPNGSTTTTAITRTTTNGTA